MTIPVLSGTQIIEKLQKHSYDAQCSYLSMYSSWLGGIVKEPGLMVVPVDDHQVHRGDGVFEAIKLREGRFYLLEQHLNRLSSSALALSLPLPMTIDEIRETIFACTEASQAKDAVLRLYISRGPGGFSANPYESIGSQMYLVITSYKPLSDVKYKQGVKVGRSTVPPKEPWLATIKTCNYLPNVMMKKESVDRNIDFTVSFDDRGVLTEGSTENIVLVDANQILVRPRLMQILRGTTMMRTFELAEQLISSGHLAGIEERDLNEMDIYSAKEVMMIGTTLDVISVSEYEGQKIGQGEQGPIALKLLNLLSQDMKSGPFSLPLRS
jgi:4-amino-4-deoxychorismate lyase